MPPSPTKKSEKTVVEWYQFDASQVVLGRLATQVAHLLMGKHKPEYAPNLVAPVFVVVTNTDNIKVTGDKLAQKKYHRHSGHPGGLKTRTLAEQKRRDSRKIIEDAVFGMLPKNNLRPERMKHLKAYPTSEHPHAEVSFIA